MFFRNKPTDVKKKRIRDNIVIIALAFIFIASSGMILMHFINEALMQRRSNQARQIMYEVTTRPLTSLTPQQILTVYEAYEEPSRRVDFDALREAFGNDDIIAHLSIEYTIVNYLVVQTTNNDFYQNHDIWRNRSSAGWVFLDYEVDLTGEDENIVIYAHNTRIEHKFHTLRHFTSNDFFRLHPYITLITPYGVYSWEIFSFYSTFIDFSYNVINFPDETQRSYMIRQFAANSMHPSNVSASPDDRILTLSTCTGRHRDERFVLHARLASVEKFLDH